MIKHLWRSIALETTIVGELVMRAEMAFWWIGTAEYDPNTKQDTTTVDRHLR